MKNSEEVQLPIVYDAAEALSFSGTADAEALIKILQPEGLSPILISPSKGLVSFYAIDYLQSSIGPYKEVAIFIPAQRPDKWLSSSLFSYGKLLSTYLPAPFGPWLKAEHITLFAWKIFVTTEIALTAGQDIWGYPKTIADIEFRRTASSFEFTLKENGAEVFTGRVPTKKGLALPLRMRFWVTTPKAIRQTCGPAASRGTFYSGRMEETSSFSSNSNSRWGQMLDNVAFRPLFWQHIPRFSALLFAPQKR